MTSSERGFTLIELLVVVAIIAILAAILFPVFARARAKAYETQCISNIKNTALAMKVYTSDYDGYYAVRWHTTLFPGYISDYGTAGCPKMKSALTDDGGPPLYSFNGRVNNSYWCHGYGGLVWYGRSGGYVINYSPADPALDVWVEAPARTVMFTETQFYPNYYEWWSGLPHINCQGLAQPGMSAIVFPHNDGVNVAWCDGHAGREIRSGLLVGCDHDSDGVPGNTPDDNLWDLGPDTLEVAQRTTDTYAEWGTCPY